MRKNIVWAVFFALFCVPHLGMAQSNKEKAKQRFIEGNSAYKNGQYGKALKSFVEANRLKAHPLMLFNIAKVYEAMENMPKAIEFYREYLKSKPKNEAQVRSKLARLQATVATWPSLNLSTTPAGATVQVGTQDTSVYGVTPITLRLSPKRHNIVLAKAGYKTKTLPIVFQAGTHRSMRIPLTADMPFIEVSSIPPGAQVSIDGRIVGQTPYTGMVPSGSHTVVIQQPNQPIVRKQVSVNSGHTAANPLRVAVNLAQPAPTTPLPSVSGQPTVTTGVLTVDVEPKGSEVRVDGQAYGQSPLSGPITLTQGSHKLYVKSPSGRTYTETVTINPGDSITSEVDLVPSTFNYRLWGWIGMGAGSALVLGGAVAGIMALGSSGDLEACRASAECLQTRREADLVAQVKDDALMADMLIWPGLAIAGTGVLLYFMAPKTPAGQKTATNLGVVPVRGGAAAFGQVRF